MITSDGTGVSDFEESSLGESDGEIGHRDDVLVKPSRDRERVAVDISYVLTGLVVTQLVERVAREALANSAPREVKPPRARTKL